MTISPRTFGIELELFLPRGKTRDGLAAHISAAGVSCRSESYGHAVPRQWKLVDDGSLGDYSHGVEVVSPVLSGEAGIHEARTVCDSLVSFGCKVNVKCGFHAHIGIPDFTPDQIGKLAINFIWFEDFFDHIMPESRRRDTSEWVHSNRRATGGSYGTAGVNAGMAIIQRAMEAAKTATASPYGLYMAGFGDGSPRNIAAETVIHAAVGRQRYMKLNLYSAYLPGESRPGNKCAEFRQHSGTVDADKVENWIRLLVAFVDKSKVSKPRPRTVTRDLTPVDEMNRYFAYIPTDEMVRRYYMARRKELAGETDRTARAAAEQIANAEPIARALVEALRARRAHVLGFARPLRRVAWRCANAIADLENAMAGRMDSRYTSRAEAINASVNSVNAQRLIPAPRASRRAA